MFSASVAAVTCDCSFCVLQVENEDDFSITESLVDDLFEAVFIHFSQFV